MFFTKKTPFQIFFCTHCNLLTLVKIYPMSKLHVLTNVQKADEVLKELSKYPRGEQEILQYLCVSNTNVGDKNEVLMILDKLVRDGYVLYDSRDRLYTTTFEGEFLKDTGGYVGLEESRLYKESLLVEQRNLQKNTFKVTVILMIGTSIAAIYYGIEICKSLFH
jgi:hypothetical protein